MMTSSNIHDITNYLKDDKFRGVFTSVLSGGTVFGLFHVATILLKWNPIIATVIIYSLIGNLLSYVVDILFAKTTFKIHGQVQRVKFSNFRTRAHWLLKSFIRAPFAKFIIVGIIETFTVLMILDTFIDMSNKSKLLMDHYILRNTFLSIMAVAIVFLLFGNILRFDWAYSDADSFHLTANMLMWVSITILFFIIHKKLRAIEKISSETQQQNQNEPKHELAGTWRTTG